MKADQLSTERNNESHAIISQTMSVERRTTKNRLSFAQAVDILLPASYGEASLSVPRGYPHIRQFRYT
jgi:hypothetical protein